MSIIYSSRKDLPCLPLAALFRAVGWSDGSELIRRLQNECPDSEWLLETIPDRVGFYQKLGFSHFTDPVMQIPCKWFK